MGCIQNKINVLDHIPPPEGQPQDPLTKPGNIVENIMIDPHINFFQNKIQKVLQPLRKYKKKIKTSKDIEQFATSDRVEHKKYIETINEAFKENSVTTTNLLQYMISQVADIREKDGVEEKFKNQSYAALRCFVYLYTGNYTYKKINQQLRRSEYEKIASVIAVVKSQLEQYNKQKFARKLKANIKYGKFIDLFRGIPKPDKLMTKSKKMYWKGFTSTTLQRKVAANFGRFHYVIQLDKENPHTYMIVPSQLSQFEQQQVILFPYFYFECIEVQDFTSGANYSIKQIGKIDN